MEIGIILNVEYGAFSYFQKVYFIKAKVLKIKKRCQQTTLLNMLKGILS